MGTSASKTESLETLLEERQHVTSDYIRTLYVDGLSYTDGANVSHKQWHRRRKSHTDVDLLHFVGIDFDRNTHGTVQAWTNQGISFVNKDRLAGPIQVCTVDELRKKGFDDAQIKNASEIVTEVNALTNDKRFTLGYAPCTTYEPICYIHNNLLVYNAKTAKRGEKYDVNEMTNIYLGKDFGNNNINRRHLNDLIRPLVGGRILSENIRLGFVRPNAELAWKIDDFLTAEQLRFVGIDELPETVVKLDEENITVEYNEQTDETTITLPNAFYVDRKATGKMVLVPVEKHHHKQHSATLNKLNAKVERAYELGH